MATQTRAHTYMCAGTHTYTPQNSVLQPEGRPGSEGKESSSQQAPNILLRTFQAPQGLLPVLNQSNPV